MNAREILSDLIHFNTITDNENKEVIHYLESYLKGLGFTTIYKSKCLVMQNKEKCDIGFLGHTDTVSFNDWSYNPFELTELDGKLYGLGTSDMKGSIAAILAALFRIDFRKMDKGIMLFFTYDEERGFSGIKELIDQKISFPKYMIIGEPTNNEFINASKGLLEFKIIFKGVSSHSSKPKEGINAIERCLKFLTKLQKYYRSLEKEVFNFQSATMNIGVINGGRNINIVPDTCEVLIDFRTISEKQNDLIIQKIKDLLKREQAICQIINNIKPFYSDLQKIRMSDFITEASFIEGSKKDILGAGPVNAHKKNEFITIDSLNKLEAQYLKLIKKWCKD